MDLGPLSFGAYYGLSQIILAVGFIIVMIFRPQGLFGDRELGFGQLGRRRQGASREITPELAPDVAAAPQDAREQSG